jgi:hypothetical protein
MDIKHKTCGIRTWENIYFSTYPPATLVHLSHRFASAPKPAAQKCLSLPHLQFNLFVISETFSTKVEPLYGTNTSHSKQETFLYAYPLHQVHLHTKNAQQNFVLR